MVTNPEARLDSPCLCFNLRKASRALSQFYDCYLGRAGLRSTQYPLLVALSRFENLSVGEVAALLGLDQSTATRTLEILAAKGYLVMSADARDARRKTLALTPAGQAKLDEARPFWQQAQEELWARLGPEQAEAMLTGLHQLTGLVK